MEVSNQYIFESPEQICRVCLKEGESDLIYLFESVELNQFSSLHENPANLIRSFCNVEISENDALPQFVCLNCLNQFESAFELFRRCLESDEKLRAQQQEAIKYEEEQANAKVETKDFIEVYEEPNENQEQFIVTEPAEFEYIEVELEDEKIKISTETELPKKQPSQPQTIQVPAKSTPQKFAVASSKKIHVKAEAVPKQPKIKKSPKITPVIRCEHCHHKFSRHSLYEIHLKKDNCQVSRSIPCTICDLKFSSKSNMSAHIKFCHERVKDYLCTTCNKFYSTSTSLKRHFLIVHAKVDPNLLSKYKSRRR